MLSSKTLFLLNDRLEQIEDLDWFDGDTESFEEWQPVANEMRKVLETRKVETLREFPEVCKELYSLLDADYYHLSGGRFNSFGNAVNDDLCRAGFHDKYNPNSVCTHRRATRVVDGVKYFIT